MSPLNADQKQLAFQVLELLGEEIIKEWLLHRGDKVKPSEASDQIPAMTDQLEQDDQAAESALDKKFPAGGGVKP